VGRNVAPDDLAIAERDPPPSRNLGTTRDTLTLPRGGRLGILTIPEALYFREHGAPQLGLDTITNSADDRYLCSGQEISLTRSPTSGSSTVNALGESMRKILQRKPSSAPPSPPPSRGVSVAQKTTPTTSREDPAGALTESALHWAFSVPKPPDAAGPAQLQGTEAAAQLASVAAPFPYAKLWEANAITMTDVEDDGMPPDQRTCAVKHMELAVSIIAVNHLPQADILGKCDPYVTLSFFEQKFNTAVHRNCLDSTFDEIFIVFVHGNNVALAKNEVKHGDFHKSVHLALLYTSGDTILKSQFPNAFTMGRNSGFWAGF
jgi:hypothetical protein